MHQAGSDAFVTSGVYFKLRSKLKKLWNIDQESKIEERLNGKLYGIGDSINDDAYIDQYKNCSKKVQYVDKTGHVNLKLYTIGQNPNNTHQQTIQRTPSAPNNYLNTVSMNNNIHNIPISHSNSASI